MLRSIFLSLLLLGSVSAEPILLDSSPKTKSQVQVLLSTDKDRLEYQNGEFEEGSVPTLIIRSESEKTILAEVPYPGDLDSEIPLLRGQISFSWSPSGSSLAISVGEGRRSHLLVFCRRKGFALPDAFIQVEFPDLAPMIHGAIPGYEDRGYLSRLRFQMQGWPGENKVMFSCGTLTSVPTATNGEMRVNAVYSFIFNISDPKLPLMESMTMMEMTPLTK